MLTVCSMQFQHDVEPLHGCPATQARKPVTIRLDRDTIAYFKAMAEESGIPYQTLINHYLRDCAVQQRKLHMEWAS